MLLKEINIKPNFLKKKTDLASKDYQKSSLSYFKITINAKIIPPVQCFAVYETLLYPLSQLTIVVITNK